MSDVNISLKSMKDKAPKKKEIYAKSIHEPNNNMRFLKASHSNS